MIRERRVRIFEINKAFLINFLNCITKFDCFALPALPEIPAGAEVENVFYRPDLDCFELCIYHESFDVVPPGTMPPMSTSYVEMFEFIRKPISDTHIQSSS